MKFIYDENKNIIGYDFSDNELEAIKINPDLAKDLISGFVEIQKTIQSETTNRVKICQEENTKHYEFAYGNSNSFGMIGVIR